MTIFASERTLASFNFLLPVIYSPQQQQQQQQLLHGHYSVSQQ